MKDPVLYRSAGEEALFVRLSPAGEATPGSERGRAADPGTKPLSVVLREDSLHQELDGFGASFTDSAAYLIHQKLTEDVRRDLMEKLFHPEKGIGLSVVRNPMGASDFARDFYSYDDMPPGESDPELRQFSIAHDEADVIPLMQEALALNPELKLFASPWSPPGWMKTTDSMIGGELKPDCYSVYAEYFARFAEAYRQAGLPVYAFTPQNESLFVPPHYPGMLMPAETQAVFIRDYLKPALQARGIAAKVFCYDHNWDRPDYPLAVLQAAEAEVDGVAWHWYGGEPAVQSEVARAFPGKEVHFTEGSGGEWIPPFEQAFSHIIRMGIEVLNHGSKSFVLWNMALDEENGPAVPGFGRSTCRGIVLVNQATGELDYNLDYYALAHFSKVIRPGARRMEVETGDSGLAATAALNPDGTIGAVLFNDSDRPIPVSLVRRGEEAAAFVLEPGQVISALLAELA